MPTTVAKILQSYTVDLTFSHGQSERKGMKPNIERVQAIIESVKFLFAKQYKHKYLHGIFSVLRNSQANLTSLSRIKMKPEVSIFCISKASISNFFKILQLQYIHTPLHVLLQLLTMSDVSIRDTMKLYFGILLVISRSRFFVRFIYSTVCIYRICWYFPSFIFVS